MTKTAQVKLIRPQEVQKTLGVCRNTLSYWRTHPNAGPPLRFVRVSDRTIRYRADDLERLIEGESQTED